MAKPRVTIVGLGFIGTSLGLALQKIKTDFEIVGHDKEHAQAGRAQQLGAVDRTDWNLISACEDAGLIILAVPVMAVKETFQALRPYLKADTVITDTASTKQPVLQWAQELLPSGVSFIGGDPLVGRVGSTESARADLFEGALYCLVPTPAADPEAVQLITNLVAALGARPYFIDAPEHDGLVAATSHLPLLMPAGLLNAVAGSPAWRELRKLAAADFRNATALAEMSPETLRDLCLANSPGIARWLDLTIQSLQTMRQAVLNADSAGLEAYFTASYAARDELLTPTESVTNAPAMADLGRDQLRSMLFGSLGHSRRQLKK